MIEEHRFVFNNTIIIVEEPYKKDKGCVMVGKKLYDEFEILFKSYDKTLIEFFIKLQEYIADLEAKLAEKEEKLNSDWYKICPRCNNPYGASQFPSKDENGKEIYVCSNCNEKELFYEPLIKQLEDQNDRLIKQRDDANLKLSKLLQRVSEQNEELANRPTIEDMYPPQMIKLANQDKISFAVEQLEQIKKIYNEYDYSSTHTTYEVLYQLNRKIKQLKEGK